MPGNTNCLICNMIDQGFFGKTNINEWLTYSYTGEHTPGRSIQELTALLNNRILTRKLLELNPGKELAFDVDTLREYIINTTINQTDTIDPNIFNVGKAIVKEYQINPFNLSGHLINKSQMTSHLYDCLNLTPRQGNIGMSKSLEKTAAYVYDILNQALVRAQKKGFFKKTQSFEIYVYDEETMQRKRIEEFFNLDQ